MNTKIKGILGAATLICLASPTSLMAADYVIDSKGAHASITLRIKHLGYSWLTARFDKFTGGFSFDEANPAKSVVNVEIDTKSFNSNHAERDKHVRSGDFLEVGKYPTATFKSTSIDVTGKSAIVHGKLTLRGVTKDVAIKAEFVGAGKDPWGGIRAGFTGTTKITMADYGIKYNLGPASRDVELMLNIEGVKKK